MPSTRTISLALILYAAVTSSSIHAANENCPYPGIYVEFDRAYHECGNGQVRRDASCAAFIELIPKLFPRYDCQRSFDAGPVPAIWLFGAAAEDYYGLLYELALGADGDFGNQWFIEEQSKAKEIFLGKGFLSVLDGHMADEYYPRIEKLRDDAP